MRFVVLDYQAQLVAERLGSLIHAQAVHPEKAVEELSDLQTYFDFINERYGSAEGGMMTKTDHIARLRDIVPLRPLTHIEALRIAELQATRFLALAGIAAPPVPEQIITGLPRLRVERLPLGVPGASQWSRGRWVVLINTLNTDGRQRFSLAHEFKHILDHPFVDFLYPNQSGIDRREWIEAVCDRFAVNLLMPRAWVKRAYAQRRIQRPADLARLFDVSLQAMRFRLEQLDFVAPAPRCSFPYERSDTTRRIRMQTSPIPHAQPAPPQAEVS